MSEKNCGADYLIALKENQPKLYASVISHFDQANENDGNGHRIDFAETIETSHGREEERRCWVSYEVETIENFWQWRTLNSVVMIESERTLNGKTSLEHRYYISSSGKTRIIYLSTREHWGIENSLHRVLDISFREDESRVKKDFAAQNTATLRHIALNLLKKEKTATVGIQNKRLTAGWDHKYLERVLDGITT